MNEPTPAIQSFARRVIAAEAAHAPTEGLVGEAARACEKLRFPLAKLVGVAGFYSLMARAMALAKAEAPALAAVQVRADGSLEGIDAATLLQGTASGNESGVVILTQLLGLLVTFIGEPLTLGIVRNAWPDATVAETGARSGSAS